MIHISGTHRVVGVPASPQILNVFPQARVVDFAGTRTALLPHGFNETKFLRNLGLEVPAPILSQYDFPAPIGEPAFRVQKLTAAMLTTHQRAYCLNGLGTGKTRAALWAFDYLRGLGLATRMLVSAPLSTLDRTWKREVFRTLPHLSVGVLYGTRAKRECILAEDHDVYVINPEGLTVLAKQLLERKDIDTFCIDELATFRNGTSERNKMARKLVPQMKWLWGMTGSPTPTEPTDAWGQCQIITPHTVHKFFGRFRDEVMVKISAFRYVPKRDATDIVFRAMQPAVRFTLEDVTELPEVIEREEKTPMGTVQSEIYDKLRLHAYAYIKNQEVTAVNAGALLNKLLQVSMGYVYDNKRGVVTLDNTSRLDALIDAINGTDRKAIVFVPFTHALRSVCEQLAKNKIDHAMVDGTVPKGERDRIFGLFQDTNKFKVLAAHPGCMAHGLTLTAADTVIWFGPTTSLETFEQANARIRRVGQRHKQLVLMFCGSPAEKRIYARLRTRQSVQDNLLEMFADATEQ